MPIITKISTQKNTKDRYNIFLDEKFAFGVDEEVLIRFDLRKGKELSELDLIQIQHEDEIRKAFNAAIQFLSYRMRSEQEVRTYLKKKEWDEPVVEAVVQKLYERKYLDDKEFACAYVRTQINGGKKGPNIISQELKEKGISSIHIEYALEEYKVDQQIEHAINLGNKVVKQNQKHSQRILKQKIEQFLLTKGFSFDIISIALEEVKYEKDEADEWQALRAQADKLQRKYRELEGFEYEQKMKQALFRKGFTIELIDRYLSENE